MGEPLRINPAEDHLLAVRLARFRVAHPEVWIQDLGRGAGMWQAVIPEPRGETIITRTPPEGLRTLLDKLDEIFGG